MSYQAQAALEADVLFAQRDRACVLQQADQFADSGDAQVAACANACLRDDAGPVNAFKRMAAAGPGIADKVDQGDGTVDQSLVTDADLLALTQVDFPTVAALYYDADGHRIT